MRSVFVLSFDHSLPVWPDGDGVDRIISASRIGPVPNAPTNLVLIEAPDAIIAAIKLHPDYLHVEDLPDAPVV